MTGVVLKALVVDDEALARARMRTLLGDCKNPAVHCVGEASNAVQAMEILQHKPVDVALLDIHMPGADGLLPAPPHDASGHTWHHPDELLFRITKYGVARAAKLPNHASAMPAFEGVLSDTEIVAALSWIKSQWPPSVQSRHDALNRPDPASR